MKLIGLLIVYYIAYEAFSQNDSVRTVPLQEVKITLHAKKKEKVKFLPSTRYVGSELIVPGNEILTCIFPTSKTKGKRLTEISVKMKKEFFPSKRTRQIMQELKKKYVALVRVRIYLKNNGKILPVFVSDTLELHYPKDRIISLDVSNESLYLDEDGICIGLELIGYRNFPDHSIIKRYPLRVSLTGRNSPFYRQQTYIRESINGMPVPLQKHFSDKKIPKKYSVRNLSVAFTYQ